MGDRKTVIERRIKIRSLADKGGVHPTQSEVFTHLKTEGAVITFGTRIC